MPTYLTDGVHLICLPYSVPCLHEMAADLGIHRCWFHRGRLPHYDIPKARRDEIVLMCLTVSSREIVRIIKRNRHRLDGAPSLCVRRGRTAEES